MSMPHRKKQIPKPHADRVAEKVDLAPEFVLFLRIGGAGESTNYNDYVSGFQSPFSATSQAWRFRKSAV
jgi:hypothetical protein